MRHSPTSPGWSARIRTLSSASPNCPTCAGSVIWPRARVDDAVYQRIGLGRRGVSRHAAAPHVLAGTYKRSEFFAPADTAAALSHIKRLGFKILGKNTSGSVLVVERRRPRAQEGARGAVVDVHGVRTARSGSAAVKRASSDVAAGIMGHGRCVAGEPAGPRA